MWLIILSVSFGVIGIILATYFYYRWKPVIRDEHARVEKKLRDIWQNMRKESLANDREAVLLLCELQKQLAEKVDGALNEGRTLWAHSSIPVKQMLQE